MTIDEKVEGTQAAKEQGAQLEARAADSGASATAAFRKKGGQGLQVDPDRVSAMATEALQALHEVIRRHEMTYAEYDALKSWLISVGEDGEWPLFLDVWVEHVVEDVNTSHREGNKGSIEGPYYVPGSPEHESPGVIDQRDDEKGDQLTFAGQIRSTDGTPLTDAKIELWHADANWHAWRPAHLHVKVSAPGHELLTAQLYFPGDPHNEDDIASAVKPELMLDVQDDPSGTGKVVDYDFVLDPA